MMKIPLKIKNPLSEHPITDCVDLLFEKPKPLSGYAYGAPYNYGADNYDNANKVSL